MFSLSSINAIPEGNLSVVYNSENLFYTIFAPNGAKESLAILKNCNPNGIPTIVIHQRQPKTRFSNAIGIPKKIIHITFAINEGTPPPYSISFPNGANDIDANLKHCFP